MSIFGTGTSDFAPLSGEENESYAVFGDIEVGGNIYLKEQTNTLTGYNVPLITADKATDDVIINTTGLNNNFNFTVGTGQDLKETIFSINPTTGLGFNSYNNPYNIAWNELSYLDGARSNLQVQIDNLSPATNTNQGYWGTVWCLDDLSNNNAGTPNLVSYTNIDPSSNGVIFTNSTRVQVENKGIYMFIMTAQMYVPSANTETVYFWIKKNGVSVADTAFKEELKNSTKLIAANWQLAMNAGDYIELAWQTTDTNMKIEHFHATGNIPAIPSVLLTVSQITFYQNNTAIVDGILQRITDINYTSNTDTTTISNNVSITGTADISGNENVGGNLVVSGRAFNTSASLSPSTYAEYCTKFYTDQQVGIAYSRGTTGVNDAAAAQAKADSAYNLADQANNTANAAAGTAGGAAALGAANSAAIAGLTTSVSTLTADVAAIQGQIGTIDDEILSLQGKTQFQTANTATTTTAFSGNMSFGTQTTISSTGTLNTYEIGTNSAGVQNIRGATINIGSSTGSYINIGTDGAFNSSISIGNLSVPIYIGGVLYLPFNPLAVGAQW